MSWLDLIKKTANVVDQVVTEIQKAPSARAHENDLLKPVSATKLVPVAQESTKPVIENRPSSKDLTVASGPLRSLLNELKFEKNLGKVVILGSNEGSWPKVLIDDGYTTEWIHSYLWRDGHERPALAFHHDRVQVRTEEIGMVTCYKCDTLLCNLNPLDDAKLELKNLKLLVNWLALHPARFIIRIIDYKNPQVVKLLVGLRARAKCGRLVGVRNHAVGQMEVFFASSHTGDSSIQDQAEAISCFVVQPKTHPKTRATWPVPPSLPDKVKQLAPLDMGRTLKEHHGLELSGLQSNLRRKFMKELGRIVNPSYNANMKSYKSSVFKALTEPLRPLIKDYDEWIVTSNEPASIERVIESKIDRAPVEEHPYIPFLWATYKAVAEYLRSQDYRIQRLTDEELVAKAKRGSSMGEEGKKFDCLNMGDFLDKCDWRLEVAKFKEALLSGKPVKGAYDSFGVREVKNKDKLRVVQCLCATGRLYEAQILGSVDRLLEPLPYTTRRALHDMGEIFQRMLDQPTPRFAICDDISGWDTRVSYSMLCMESAFLQLLTDDAEHKKEIEHLYRLYAFPVISYTVPDENSPTDSKKSVRVFYQLQGQVASGRRVTYSMNTMSQIVVQLVRAAMSQKTPVELKRMGEWVSDLLNDCPNSYKFGGMMCGDDSVIILGKQEAFESAKGNGIKALNQMGFLRKKPSNERADGPSKIVSQIEDINFCNRNFVEVAFSRQKRKGLVVGLFRNLANLFCMPKPVNETSRLMPIKQVNEILMKKLLRERACSKEEDLAWTREQGKNLLVEYFHIYTVRMLALAVLSSTPSNITLNEDSNEGVRVRFTEKPLITESSVLKEINEKYFGKGTRKPYRKEYRAKSFDDLGYISNKEQKLYDLDHSSVVLKEWVRTLPELVRILRKQNQDPKYTYDDWIEIDQPSGFFKSFYVKSSRGKLSKPARVKKVPKRIVPKTTKKTRLRPKIRGRLTR